MPLGEKLCLIDLSARKRKEAFFKEAYWSSIFHRYGEAKTS